MNSVRTTAANWVYKNRIFYFIYFHSTNWLLKVENAFVAHLCVEVHLFSNGILPRVGKQVINLSRDTEMFLLLEQWGGEGESPAYLTSKAGWLRRYLQEKLNFNICYGRREGQSQESIRGMSTCTLAHDHLHIAFSESRNMILAC